MNYLPTTLTPSGLSTLLGKNGLARVDIFKREILVLQCVVAGTSFRNIHKVENELLPGTKLILQSEAENKHDELAVKILLNDYLLGYIPCDSNEVIARLMDAGKNFHAVVTELEWEGAWAKLDIHVYLND
jgi:hypothetical protein